MTNECGHLKEMVINDTCLECAFIHAMQLTGIYTDEEILENLEKSINECAEYGMDRVAAVSFIGMHVLNAIRKIVSEHDEAGH
jgi:hypothetical protein